MIFHILDKPAWESAVRAGIYAPPSLQTEGFIHCSTRSQIVGTANRFFHRRNNLLLLCIDPGRLTAELRFEPPADPADPRAHEEFPHIYGPISLDAVARVLDLPTDSSGSFSLPEGV